MAVTITDNMTVWNSAENATDWTGTNGNTYSGFNREGTNCLGQQASSGTAHLYYTGTSTNLSDHTIFIWLRSGNPTAESTGGFRIVAGDASHLGAFYVGGSDNYGFFYNGWSCFKLNTTNLPTNYATLAGTVTSINWSAITRIGGGFNYASKAVGNTPNVFIDVIRYVSNSTAALTIGGGGSSTQGTFAEIVAEDESTTYAWGVFRTAISGSKAYEQNFGVDWGNSGSSSSYFADSDSQIFISGTAMDTGAMDVDLLANATGTNSYVIDNSIIVNIGTDSNWNVASTNLDEMKITDSQFVGLGTFTAAGNSTDKYIRNTIFNGCGQVDPGDIDFTGNTITGTTDANGGLLIDATGTANMSDLVFISDGTGHAIYITAAGTYDFTNFTFSGYSTASLGTNSTPSSGSTDAMVYNNSGGAVTINISGGDNISVRNGASATTTVISNVTYTITVQDSGANPIIGAQVAMFKTSDDSVLHASSPTDENGEVTGSVSASTGAVYIRVRQSTNIATFLTSASGIDATGEVITTDVAHSFVDGEAVVYSKDGGSAVVGLTEGTTYYVNSITTTTLSLHTSAANAIADSSRVNLSVDGTETHHLDPVRYFPTSTVGTIGTTDFAVTITMIEDTTATG